MPSIGAPELLIVLAIVVVLFGATRIGDIGKGLGRGIKEFRKNFVTTRTTPRRRRIRSQLRLRTRRRRARSTSQRFEVKPKGRPPLEAGLFC